MKNENKYKQTTSLILATIMIAGSLTFAIPPLEPLNQAYAQLSQPNLYVSAENSLFDNSFAGPMVIEVVVNDPDLKEIDEKETEPDVTVNGKDLRMVQATDGNWYAYFAAEDMARAADTQVSKDGTSLDFGTLCPKDSTSLLSNLDYSDTDRGIFFGGDDVCEFDNTTMNVIRESKTPTIAISETTSRTGVDRGQVNVGDNEFPMIQLYTFSVDGTVEVKYNKGGGAQQVNLVYLDDTSSYASLTLDRDSYPQGAHVHAVIVDFQLNIDPTDEDSWTFGTTNGNTFYQVFNENGEIDDNLNDADTYTLFDIEVSSLNFEDNGVLRIDPDKDDRGEVLQLVDNKDQMLNSTGSYEEVRLIDEDNDNAMIIDNNGNEIIGPVTFIETQSNSGIFKNTDEGDDANIRITNDARRGTTATIDYNDADASIVVRNYNGNIEFDLAALGGEWNSGKEIAVTLTDEDLNKNSLIDEDLDIFNTENTIIPSIRIGNPLTLADVTVLEVENIVYNTTYPTLGSYAVDSFSDIMRINLLDNVTTDDMMTSINFTFSRDISEYFVTDDENVNNDARYHYLNYDVRLITNVTDMVTLTHTNNAIENDMLVFDLSDGNSLIYLNDPEAELYTPTNKMFTLAFGPTDKDLDELVIALDIFSFGQIEDGVESEHRFNDAIYRLELEETGDNTGKFTGSVEYLLLNQLNVNMFETYSDGIDPIGDSIEIIVHNDLTDEDSVRVNYLDRGADGVPTQVADQVEAPTHDGVVSFDADNYKVADTVTVTLRDPDLNTDVETIQVFTVVDQEDDPAIDMIGAAGYGISSDETPFGKLLDITFDDATWTRIIPDNNGESCDSSELEGVDAGLAATGFTLTETGRDTGVFVGTFQIPSKYCADSVNQVKSVTGTDIEVNYLDYRDASGEITEFGASAGIRAYTGSVSLDRTVYPVPFGTPDDFTGHTNADSPNGRSIFPIHSTGIDVGNEDDGINEGEYLQGDLVIHVRITDPDFDVSANGEDSIAYNTVRETEDGIVPYHGPLKVTISRGANAVTLATAGAAEKIDGSLNVIQTGDVGVTNNTREFGPIAEIAPDAGVFELDLPIRYTDGPASSDCPEPQIDYQSPIDGSRGTEASTRFILDDSDDEDQFCILQGDILTVEYTDPTDASGDPNTVTDSATFDLRNGVLQSDKSVYIIGGDMILTLIEPDLDLDNDETETYTLDLIEWDSDADDTTLGSQSGNQAIFDPEPAALRETGDSTGIFQVNIEIPEDIDGDRLERGEEIVLEYTDWGPSGANYVGDEDEDVNLTVFTSNFGATVELDQKVYTWTDKVFITIVAPDHNFDSDLVDEIGETEEDPITISTRSGDIDNYRLVETGTDTGIFTGEVILTGFDHDADGDINTGRENTGFDTNPRTSEDNTGPTDGFLEAEEEDGISVSFEFSEDETVIGSALIRWNIGEVQWLEASYPATGTGVVRVVDPDMNLEPESVDNFEIDVWSDSDSGGIDLTVTETNEATGIFEGTVFFTVTDESSGHRLRVSESDTVTADYEDNTLPEPYSPAEELKIKGTTIIGTIVPPLERAPATNLRVVDAFGNALSSISIDQQVQITADLTSGQDKDQSFAYLVQVQDSNGVTVTLAWISGSLAPGQSFSPSQSWTPDAPGSYDVTVFVWESVDNPTALSPSLSIQVDVA